MMKIFRNPRDDWLTRLHSDLRVDHIITFVFLHKKMVSV